jgi:hypothetical protein
VAYKKAHARKRASFSKYLASLLSHVTISKVVLNALASGLAPLPLDSSALEKFMSDSPRCSTEARQEMIMIRNAPSLSWKEYLDLEAKLNGERPICTICQEVLERPRSAPVKLLVAEDTSPSVPTNNNHEANKRLKSPKLGMQQCSAFASHAFHLGCVKSWFFGDDDTEMNCCPTCCAEVYKKQDGGRV